MLQSRVVSNVRDYTNNQLTGAGLSLDGLASSGLIGLAGCDLDVSWFNKLLADRVTKLTSMQLIGLRRLFGDPIDTIIGTELYEVKHRNRMAGLKRIRYEVGESKPKTQKDFADRANCSTPIIARIESASYYAVRERWADINTDVEKIYSGLLSGKTFSVDVLTRLKFSLYINIEDIMGLGVYDDDCFDMIVFSRGRKKNLRFSPAQLDQLSPLQRKHPEQVFSPISEEEPDPVHETSESSQELLAQFASNRERCQADSDTVTGFRPQGI
jgi:hypothetical protein